MKSGEFEIKVPDEVDFNEVREVGQTEEEEVIWGEIIRHSRHEK